MLSFPKFGKPFNVETDESAVAVGAVLSQKKEYEKIHPIQFGSHTMNAAEPSYSAIQWEALAVLLVLKKIRVFLLSTEQFTLVTDHQAFQYAFKKKYIYGPMARWIEIQSEYHFTNLYNPGPLIALLTSYQGMAVLSGSERWSR